VNTLTQRIVKNAHGFEIQTLVRCLRHREATTPADVIYEATTPDNCQLCDEEWFRETGRITEAQTWLNQIEASDVAFISGPMSGLADFNRPAFWRMEHILKVNRQCQIINPANNPQDQPYEWQMREDIKHLVTSATVMIMLQHWRASRGSRVEHAVGSILQLRIYEEL